MNRTVKLKVFSDFKGEFCTWKIEESVKNVETVGVVSLNELVGVVNVNLFPVERKHNRDRYYKCNSATEKLSTNVHKLTFQG